VLSCDRTAVAIVRQHPDVVGPHEVDGHRADRSELVDEATSLAYRIDMHVVFGALYDLPPLIAGGPDWLHADHSHQVADPARGEPRDPRLPTQDPNPTPALAPGFPGVVFSAEGAVGHVFNTDPTTGPIPASARGRCRACSRS